MATSTYHHDLHYKKYNYKLQKLYSLPRNLRTGNKSPALYVKKPFSTGDLPPALKIFIERPATCRNFDTYLHAKNKIYSSLLFWDIVKILQTCYFKYCEKAWPCPSVMIVSACRKLCWNQFVGKIDVYLHAKNQLHL